MRVVGNRLLKLIGNPAIVFSFTFFDFQVILGIVALYYIFLFALVNFNSPVDDVTEEFVDLNYYENSRIFINQSGNSIQFIEEEFTSGSQSKLHVAMTIRNTHILLKDDQGHLVLNKSIDQYLYHPDRSVSLMDAKPHSRLKYLKEGKLLRRWNRADEVIASSTLVCTFFLSPLLYFSCSPFILPFHFLLSIFHASPSIEKFMSALHLTFISLVFQHEPSFHYSNFSSAFLVYQ